MPNDETVTLTLYYEAAASAHRADLTRAGVEDFGKAFAAYAPGKTPSGGTFAGPGGVPVAISFVGLRLAVPDTGARR